VGLNTQAHSEQPKPRRRISSIRTSLRDIRLLAPACDMSRSSSGECFWKPPTPALLWSLSADDPVTTPASIPINPNVANELRIGSSAAPGALPSCSRAREFKAKFKTWGTALRRACATLPDGKRIREHMMDRGELPGFGLNQRPSPGRPSPHANQRQLRPCGMIRSASSAHDPSRSLRLSKT
jgi:hypothetical protein